VIICLAPVINCQLPQHVTYNVMRAERWAHTYRASRKNKHCIFTTLSWHKKYLCGK